MLFVRVFEYCTEDDYFPLLVYVFCFVLFLGIRMCQPKKKKKQHNEDHFLRAYILARKADNNKCNKSYIIVKYANLDHI